VINARFIEAHESRLIFSQKSESSPDRDDTNINRQRCKNLGEMRPQRILTSVEKNIQQKSGFAKVVTISHLSTLKLGSARAFHRQLQELGS